MNKEEIYGIVSQGLNIANQKGAFTLDESAVIQKSLLELKAILIPTETTQAEKAE
jgi:hypothetical protein